MDASSVVCLFAVMISCDYRECLLIVRARSKAHAKLISNPEEKLFVEKFIDMTSGSHGEELEIDPDLIREDKLALLEKNKNMVCNILCLPKEVQFVQQIEKWKKDEKNGKFGIYMLLVISIHLDNTKWLENATVTVERVQPTGTFGLAGPYVWSW